MIHTIQMVKAAETTVRRAELTWQTQAFCTFISNTIEDNKARETMVSNASKLTLLDDDLLEEAGVDTTSSNRSNGERTLEDIIENGSVAEAMRENNRKNLDVGKLRHLGQA